MLWKGSQVPQEGNEEEAVTKKAITNIHKYFTTFFYLFLFFQLLYSRAIYMWLLLYFITFSLYRFTHDIYPHPHPRLQSGKTFCASFCASQAQGGLFCWCVCLSLREHWERFGWDWMKCTRCERLLLEKSFYLCVVFLLRHLQITLDSEQPMLKQKRIIPSVWGGIKRFEHFQYKEASIFLIVHSIYLWVDFAFFRRLN